MVLHGIARRQLQRQPAAIIAGLIIALIAAILWKARLNLRISPSPAAEEITFPAVYRHGGDHVLGICGGEAFTHLSSEFKNPERIDFPRALIIGLMWPRRIYWACTAVVLHFGVYSDKIAATTSLRLLLFISSVSGRCGQPALLVTSPALPA